MKRFILPALLLIVVAVVFIYIVPNSQRERVCNDKDWMYSRSEELVDEVLRKYGGLPHGDVSFRLDESQPIEVANNEVVAAWSMREPTARIDGYDFPYMEYDLSSRVDVLYVDGSLASQNWFHERSALTSYCDIPPLDINAFRSSVAYSSDNRDIDHSLQPILTREYEVDHDITWQYSLYHIPEQDWQAVSLELNGHDELDSLLPLIAYNSSILRRLSSEISEITVQIVFEHPMSVREFQKFTSKYNVRTRTAYVRSTNIAQQSVYWPVQSVNGDIDNILAGLSFSSRFSKKDPFMPTDRSQLDIHGIDRIIAVLPSENALALMRDKDVYVVDATLALAFQHIVEVTGKPITQNDLVNAIRIPVLDK